MSHTVLPTAAMHSMERGVSRTDRYSALRVCGCSTLDCRAQHLSQTCYLGSVGTSLNAPPCMSYDTCLHHGTGYADSISTCNHSFALHIETEPSHRLLQPQR